MFQNGRWTLVFSIWGGLVIGGKDYTSTQRQDIPNFIKIMTTRACIFGYLALATLGFLLDHPRNRKWYIQKHSESPHLGIHEEQI